MAIIAISRSKQSRNLDSCYRVIKSFRIWLTSSCHQIYHLMFKNKTDRVATISTWIRGCYIEHWRNYCSTLLHCFMIATFHQLNAYVQIAQCLWWFFTSVAWLIWLTLNPPLRRKRQKIRDFQSVLCVQLYIAWYLGRLRTGTWRISANQNNLVTYW